MNYLFFNTKQGGIQNTRRNSRLICQRCHGRMDVKIFLIFIVAENTESVNIEERKDV